MTFADEEEFSAFVARDDWLPMLTGDAVASALDGYSLSLSTGKTFEWLAMAVRRALAMTMRAKDDGPDRISNADLRARLERLRDIVQSTWQELFECDLQVDDRLWTIAWRHWDGEGGNISEPLAYRRYKATVAELEWLASFLQTAAEETLSPKGPWRAKERKWLRIERAYFLAPIFEAAFGEKVSANNYPDDARHKAPTPFMDFYKRIVSVAFGKRETANLSEVVKAACRQHRKQPVQFDEGFIPGL